MWSYGKKNGLQSLWEIKCNLMGRIFLWEKNVMRFQKQPCNVFNIFIIWAYKLAITYSLLKMLLKQNAIKAKNVNKGNKYILNNLIVSNNNKYGFIR